MKCIDFVSRVLVAAGIGLLTSPGFAQTPAAAVPYAVVMTNQVMGSGSIDYVYADNAGRRLFVPRGDQILVFNLDTLQSVAAITNTGGHGVAVDPNTHHGFSSSTPVTMFDTRSLAVIKKINTGGNPDGIFFEPFSQRIYVFSHSPPNATVIDPTDGSITGTIDLNGAPEQAASDDMGHLYVDIESADNVAVVDVKTLAVTTNYPIGDKAHTPAGLGLDAKNHVLFAFCRNPATAVMLNAADGKIVGTLPIGNGTDGGGFNPATMEAFSSQRDGSLTIIKENSPTNFVVEQTVHTKVGAKTCALDTSNNRVVVIALEPGPRRAPGGGQMGGPVSTPEAVQPPPSPKPSRRGMGGPAFLDIIAVGR